MGCISFLVGKAKANAELLLPGANLVECQQVEDRPEQLAETRSTCAETNHSQKEYKCEQC